MYILLARLGKTQKIKPGRLPEADYKEGIYLYVGRARTGLLARIRRHIRRQKKLFWHIDYLLQKAKIEAIWIRKHYFDECNIADMIGDFHTTKGIPVKGFGSSDCRCPGHLFYFPPGSTDFRFLKNKLEFEKARFDGNDF